MLKGYKKLMEEIIEENGENAINQLIEFDLKTQARFPCLKRQNTILRILDKWLWLAGNNLLINKKLLHEK